MVDIEALRMARRRAADTEAKLRQAIEERRSAARTAAAGVTAEVAFARGHAFRTVAVLDLGRGGLRFATETPPAAGQEIRVVLRLPDTRVLRLWGAVRHVAAPRATGNADERWQIGVLFLACDADRLRVLDEALAAPEAAAP